MKKEKYIKLYDVIFNAEYTDKTCHQKWKEFDYEIKRIKDFDLEEFYDKSSKFTNQKGFSKDISGVNRIANEFPCLTQLGERAYLLYKKEQIKRLIQEYKKITSDNIKIILNNFELEAIKTVLDFCEQSGIISYKGKVYIYASDEVYDILYDNIVSLYDVNYKTDMHQVIKEFDINNYNIENEELKKRCIDILSGNSAFDRVFNQATQVLETEVKKKAKLENTKLKGLGLMSTAIASKKENTILLFSEKNEIQEAYSFLFKGMIGAYRNPTHHSIDFNCTREDALKCCAFIDYLLKELGNCQVLDPNTKKN